MLRDLKTVHDLATALELPSWTAAERLLNDRPYRLVEIFQKGKLRHTWEPRPGLKVIQRKLTDLIGREYNAPWTVHGYVRGKSPITNAANHVGQNFVLNFDIADFFGSIDRECVFKCFISDPYNVRPRVAGRLASLVCFGEGLPAGAPTSPMVANVVMQELDRRLEYVSFLYDGIYTRYSDDMTISTNERKFPARLAEENRGRCVIGDRLQKEIDRYGFTINHRKTRLAAKSEMQIVTGLVVNDRVNVRRSYIRKIRYELMRWKAVGLDTASSSYLSSDFEPEDYRTKLFGQIQHVGFVRGFNDQLYRRLEADFAALQGLTRSQ